MRIAQGIVAVLCLLLSIAGGIFAVTLSRLIPDPADWSWNVVHLFGTVACATFGLLMGTAAIHGFWWSILGRELKALEKPCIVFAYVCAVSSAAVLIVWLLT